MQRGACRLTAVDRAAADLGLAPGMTLADARAHVPAVRVFEHDRAADQRLLLRLAQGCGRYTPVVALDGADGLLLDIGGSAHLFHGEEALAARIARRHAHLGLTVRLAGAATPPAASALARHALLPVRDEAQAIAALPVAALGLDGAATQGLCRAGLRTVGAVAARPMAGIAARFGMAAVLAVRRLEGAVETPLDPVRLPAAIRVEQRLAEPVAKTETVLVLVGGLIAQAVARLGARGEGGRRFALLLERSDGAVRRLEVETARPVRSAALLLRLFEERIETLADPLDPGFGFDALVLAVVRAEPMAPEQLPQPGADGSADGGRADEALAALIERLSIRLGRGRVLRLHPGDAHLPEEAQRSHPAIAAPPAAAWPSPAAGEPPLRPLTLFDPPQPIDVVALVPDGPPQRFRWGRAQHRLAASEGPERIAPPWWQTADGLPRVGPVRDYYRVEDSAGRRFWIFRHGGYEGGTAPRWYLHGLFA
jgi:protein ImuB